jgi:flagellar biosynthetic protein FlhB
MAGDERTEKPTGKRQKENRRKGIAARSRELPLAVSLFAAVIALPMAAKNLMGNFAGSLASAMSAAGSGDSSVAIGEARKMIGQGVHALAVPVLLVSGSTMLSTLLVVRQKPNFSLLRPRLSGLNPKAGIKRVFSAHGLQELVRSLVKLAILLLIGYAAWRSGVSHVVATQASLDSALHAITGSTLHLMLEVALVTMVIGVGDAVWARRRYGKQTKMTKQEVKDEAKGQEVNPHVKGAIRSKQMKLSRSRMMAAVAGADVVLANPTHIAVALKYEAGTLAPVVVAKGAGEVAQRIKALAADNDVPVIENKPLARALHAAADVGDVIPVELYRAVAEVLAAVFAARRRRGLPAQRTAPAVPKTNRRAAGSPRDVRNASAGSNA